MAKTNSPSAESLLQDLLKMHVPAEYLEYFELYKVIEYDDCFHLVLHEKASQVPKELEGSNAVLDGFVNPLSILSHSFSLKKIVLIVKRRRWKLPGTDQHYSNTYQLHPQGARITPAFSAFLKESH